MSQTCHVQTHASQQSGSNLHSYSSALFYGGRTVKDGRIEQTNFDTYNSMRIGELPKVGSIIMPSGVGEPTICIAAPAVLNAYFCVGTKSIENSATKLLPQRTTCISQFYSLRSISICVASGLERDHSCPQGRHRPGGCQTIRQRELPP